MSWSAHLQHTATGLAIVFAGPVSRLDMTSDTAAHFASLLAVEARHRMRGVVAAVAKTSCNHQGYGSEVCATVAQNNGDSNAPHGGAGIHPLCCDCSPCLNGDHHG